MGDAEAGDQIKHMVATGVAAATLHSIDFKKEIFGVVAPLIDIPAGFWRESRREAGLDSRQ